MAEQENKKQTGKCLWFNARRGFGFIQPDKAGAADVYVHQSNLHAPGFRSLQKGEAVVYSLETDKDGRFKAVNVTGPKGAYVQGQPKRERKAK